MGRIPKLDAALTLFATVGIAWVLWQHGPGHKITDQELLREAVAEWKRGGEQYGPTYQILEQQAAQGYYDDAVQTASLLPRGDEKQSLVVEIAKVRAENGDIQGARGMAGKITVPAFKAKALQEIALDQAGRGDLPGALETVGPAADSDEVRGAFARLQIKRGDLAGALETSADMSHQAADQVFYGVGDALPERAKEKEKRVRELAARMEDRKRAALFTELALYKFSPGEVRTIQAVPCDEAYSKALGGKFAEADAVIEKNKCSFVSFVTKAQFAVDPASAERILRTYADADDLVRGLNDFAVVAAEKGDIGTALHFLDNVENLSGSGKAWGAVHIIARAWTIKDGPKAVIKWTHSRPSTDERTWALIGMAEALGHGRPHPSTEN